MGIPANPKVIIQTIPMTKVKYLTKSLKRIKKLCILLMIHSLINCIFHLYIFIILLTVVFGSSLVLLFLAIGAVEWLTMARIVRGQVLMIKI